MYLLLDKIEQRLDISQKKLYDPTKLTTGEGSIMAKETIYRSDYNGQVIDYDFGQEPQPYKITIQAPGVAATKAESFTEVYLSEDDYRHLVASLRGYYEDEEGNKKKAGPINRGVADDAPRTKKEPTYATELDRFKSEYSDKHLPSAASKQAEQRWLKTKDWGDKANQTKQLQAHLEGSSISDKSKLLEMLEVQRGQYINAIVLHAVRTDLKEETPAE